MDLTQPYRITKPKLEAKGLQMVDLMSAFQERCRAVNCYGAVDTHFNVEGHRVAANVILPYVLAELHKKLLRQ
jgi:hypothetical protein